MADDTKMTDSAFDREEAPDTRTRLRDLTDQGKGYVIVVTRAYGPNGEDLIAHDGPHFSGEPGIKLLVRQGDIEEEVILSPFFGDPSKVSDADFENGERCELLCPESKEPLDELPGMTSDDGGHYHAIYITEDLENGELVAVSDVWGDYNSRVLSEGEILSLYAESEVHDVEESDFEGS